MPKRSQRLAIPDPLQYAADQQMRILLVCDAAVAAGLAIYTLPVVVTPLFDDSFLTMSKFSWASWCPSFTVMIALMTAMTVASVLLAFMGIKAAFEEARLKRLAFSAFCLGVILLIITGYTASAATRARPFVYRAVNLICQDSTVWGCESQFVNQPPTAPQRRLVGSTGLNGLARPAHRGGGGVRSVVPALLAVLQDLQLRDGLGRDADAARRLHAASAALHFEQWLKDKVDDFGTSELCTQVGRLCVEPPGFDFTSACVCSGQWTNREAHRNMLQPAPGHWLGTVGAYCDYWKGNGQGTRWCYVSPVVNCSSGVTGVYQVQGKTFTRGDGPCGDAVQTRSMFVLESFKVMRRPIKFCGILGFLLLTLSFCAGLLVAFPSKATAPHAQERALESTASDSDREDSSILSTKGSYYAGGSRGKAGGRGGAMMSSRARGGDMESDSFGPSQAAPPSTRSRQPLSKEESELELRFEEAQREAMRLLTDTTPADLKNMLYAYYRQAEEGDAPRERPSLLHPRERAQHDHWTSCSGMSRMEAIKGYVRAVNLLE